jgi:lysophospholipid acyltransferase (LPLAT)-like uncharacterized protein
MPKCITHHHACECREETMRKAFNLMIDHVRDLSEIKKIMTLLDRLGLKVVRGKGDKWEVKKIVYGERNI